MQSGSVFETKVRIELTYLGLQSSTYTIRSHGRDWSNLSRVQKGLGTTQIGTARKPNLFVDPTGFEPATSSLPAKHSTAELWAQNLSSYG